ncbi:tyrosine-protein kinase transmembrane receptor Ror-like [Schistocerca americana]|uniref:tyrosine-protein kinase transmembrane receptor Ror-like n=1 Tax=Schistocerca americana TaxID=7009 RepID=UPI001F4F59C8|nr:tyrosine-protein kinase transmembrane receptor Ror-like [Schistocerca americana]
MWNLCYIQILIMVIDVFGSPQEDLMANDTSCCIDDLTSQPEQDKNSLSDNLLGAENFRQDALPENMTLLEGKAVQATSERIHQMLVDEGFCEVYQGKTCSTFLANKSVYIPLAQTQIMLERKLEKAFMVVTTSKDLSKGCEAFARPSLCYSAFPLCHMSSCVPENGKENCKPGARPRRICREDCEILENEMCSMEYAIAKRHPLIGQQVQLPECDHLPVQGSQASKDCISLGIQRAGNIEPSETCYWGRGESYRGVAETTSIGRCSLWSHQFSYKSSDHPEIGGGHNYCRNPGGVEPKPWCFIVNDEQFRKEPCDIPQCVQSLWLYITIASVAFVIIIIAFLLYCFCLRQSPRSNTNQNFNEPQGIKIAALKSSLNSSPNKSNNKNNCNTSYNQMMEMNLLLPATREVEETVSAGLRAREYELKDVKFLQELGEGAFGKVYKGEVTTGDTGDTPLLVAIKTLKENATPKTQADFRREVELMTDLRHSNIVCLLGVVMRGEPLCMLFEYMTQGDLHEFLICHSPRSDVSAFNDEGNNHVLDQNDFLHIAMQIGAGMEYLSSHHYVHRDLAARNCLVGDNLTVKISDFGLSRDVYSSDYYRVQSKSLLPVRWMPSESILYGKFTTESDVWSYGVVLWEIYSYGLQPYYGYSNQEVIDMIRSRQLLPCPEDCPSSIYSLMIECWHEIPNRRPSFPEINARLLSLCKTSPGSCSRLMNHCLSGKTSEHEHSVSCASSPSKNVVDFENYPFHADSAGLNSEHYKKACNSSSCSSPNFEHRQIQGMPRYSSESSGQFHYISAPKTTAQINSNQHSLPVYHEMQVDEAPQQKCQNIVQHLAHNANFHIGVVQPMCSSTKPLSQETGNIRHQSKYSNSAPAQIIVRLPSPHTKQGNRHDSKISDI